MVTGPLLDIRGLSILFQTGAAPIEVISDVSFAIGPRESVGLVGESGCGKSVTALAIMGLLPGIVSRAVGEVLLDGTNLIGLPDRAMRKVRGRRIGMVFQEPMTALDPVFTIGDQISETVRTHFRATSREARARTIDALASVGIPSPAQRYESYPHQLSGGMRQRVMIAMALVCEPELLIADEPTTALDVTIQGQILDLLMERSARMGTALLLITHDLGVVAENCSRVITMYAGQVVETAAVDEMLVTPLHPYTSGLLRALPRLSRRRERLPSIGGRVPSPFDMPTGCRFEPRCSHAMPPCTAQQNLDDVAGRSVRCWRHAQMELPGAVT